MINFAFSNVKEDLIFASGRENTIKELVHLVSKFSGSNLFDDIQINEHLLRAGDPISSYADTARTSEILNWETEKSFDDLVLYCFNKQLNDKNKSIFNLSITILGIYIILFLYFKLSPWGLMDDYRFVYLIPELLNDFLFINFEIISSRAFDRGMFQPFFVLQQFIQYMPGYLTLPYISYLFNLLIVFLCHFYFYKGFNRFIEIRYSVSVFVFFIWPFTNDLLFLISLQEKFIFLVGGLLLYKIRESSNYFLVFLATLSLPLIKLQGSIFLFIFLAIYLIEKKTIWFTGALGLATGIIIQAYFIFFNQGDYFVYDSNFEKLFNNLVVKEHLFVILISFTLIFYLIKKIRLK